MAEIPCLLLAAGASSRMGRAKHMLPWGDGLLIEHQIQTLLKTGHPVLVVLGHQSDQILPVLEKYPVMVSVNTRWQDGMGSSIAHGIRQLMKEFPDAAGALITQLDQPLLTSSHFENMFGSFQAGSRQIVVSQSPSGWQGVPVLFDRLYFKALQTLSGDEGARKVFRSHAGAVQTLESGDILEDMDTPEAYQLLLERYMRQTRTKIH
jgi:molybdenum cofactor cytidylyltransferase